MKKVILDTNILIRHPEILSVDSDELELIIPDLVFEQVSKFKNTKTSLVDLIRNASNAGTIKIQTIASAAEKLKSGLVVDYVDFQITSFSKYLIEQGNEVVLATDDKSLQIFAMANGVNSVGLAQLLEMITNNEKVNQDIQKQTTKFNNQQNKSVILGFLLGFIIAMLLVIIYLNFDTILQTINVWGTIISTLIISIVLFIFRELKQLMYGAVEFFIGIASVILIFYPDFDYSGLVTDSFFIIKIIGGLYIMVRGLDNIYKALEGKKIRLWIDQKIFSK